MEPWSVVAFEAAMAMLSPGRGLGSGSAGLDFVVDVPKSAIVTVSLPERHRRWSRHGMCGASSARPGHGLLGGYSGGVLGFGHADSHVEAERGSVSRCRSAPTMNLTVSGASRPMDQPGHGGGIFVEDLWKRGYRWRRTLAESGSVAGGISAARIGPQRCRRSNPTARCV